MESLKIFFLAVLVGVAGCSEGKEDVLSPQQALSEFYASQGAEDQLMDPLIIRGKEVVSLVLIEIENKDMKKRRYAIGALGNIGDKSALPILEKILSDDTEKNYFRCDAINSISMIDFERGRELAELNKDNPIDCLSSLSANILTSEYDTWLSKNHMRRTLEDAHSGKHY